jgi:hypothetical protein
MIKNRWKMLTETIGMISIVLGLLLVAWEIRQANNIARAEAVMGLAEQWNEFNSSLTENPDVARLYRYVRNPDEEGISETDRARIEGMAWHFINIFWSAHIAHENGLLDDADLRNYRADLEWMVEFMPGLNEEWIRIYETTPYMHGIFVLEPIANLEE